MIVAPCRGGLLRWLGAQHQIADHRRRRDAAEHEHERENHEAVHDGLDPVYAALARRLVRGEGEGARGEGWFRQEGGAASSKGPVSSGPWPETALVPRPSLLDPTGQSDTRLRRNAFEMTDTELSVIAALAHIGLIRVPVNGYRMPAATGTPTAL